MIFEIKILEKKCSENLPFDSNDAADDVNEFSAECSIGLDPASSFTARLSSLVDSVIAINKTFC